MLARMRAKGQLTIPAELRESAHLAEGTSVELIPTEEGLLLRPQVTVDAADAWFWNTEWQAGERLAVAETIRGETTVYESDEEFLTSLED